MRTIVRRGRAFLLSSLCLVVPVGCSGSGDLPKTYPVTGKVVAKGGTPVAGGMVRFESDDKNVAVSGDIQEDGSFTLRTQSLKGKGTASGAPEGNYQVTIQFPYPANGRPIPAVILPGPYKVEPKDENPFTLEVPSRKR